MNEKKIKSFLINGFAAPAEEEINVGALDGERRRGECPDRAVPAKIGINQPLTDKTVDLQLAI